MKKLLILIAILLGMTSCHKTVLYEVSYHEKNSSYRVVYSTNTKYITDHYFYKGEGVINFIEDYIDIDKTNFVPLYEELNKCTFVEDSRKLLLEMDRRRR